MHIGDTFEQTEIPLGRMTGIITHIVLDNVRPVSPKIGGSMLLPILVHMAKAKLEYV